MNIRIRERSLVPERRTGVERFVSRTRRIFRTRFALIKRDGMYWGNSFEAKNEDVIPLEASLIEN
jgi:hypothetical protein